VNQFKKLFHLVSNEVVHRILHYEKFYSYAIWYVYSCDMYW